MLQAGYRALLCLERFSPNDPKAGCFPGKHRSAWMVKRKMAFESAPGAVCKIRIYLSQVFSWWGQAWFVKFGISASGSVPAKQSFGKEQLRAPGASAHQYFDFSLKMAHLTVHELTRVKVLTVPAQQLLNLFIINALKGVLCTKCSQTSPEIGWFIPFRDWSLLVEERTVLTIKISANLWFWAEKSSSSKRKRHHPCPLPLMSKNPKTKPTNKKKTKPKANKNPTNNNKLSPKQK